MRALSNFVAQAVFLELPGAKSGRFQAPAALQRTAFSPEPLKSNAETKSIHHSIKVQFFLKVQDISLGHIMMQL